MAGAELPSRAIREQIGSAVDLVVHQSRMRDGTRKIVSVTEVLFAAKQQVERLAAPPPAGLLQQHGFAIYAAVLVFFFVVSFPLTRLAAYLERRLI